MMEPMLSLGVDAKTGRPIEVPLSLFFRHAWIMGMTGAMKTIFVTSLVVQIRLLCPEACIFFGDPAGDQYPFHRLREATRRVGRQFRFLSTNPADDWDTFEPLQAVTPLDEVGVVKASSLLVSSLSLDYGEGFGKAYFGKINYSIFHAAFSDLLAAGTLCPKFREFLRYVARSARRAGIRDVSEAQLAAESLLSYPQFDEAEDPDRRIVASRAIDEGETIYGFLPTLLEPPTRMMLALLVWSLVLEAMRRTYAGLPPKRVFIVIDEFAAVAAAKAFSDLLTLARKYHISLILLNQTSTQLVSRDRDLRPVLFDNTALKVWFTPLGDDIDLLRSLSRDVTKSRGKTVSSRGLSGSVSLGEVYEPMLERNDALDTTFRGLEAFVIANEFTGHREPIRLRFIPEVSREEHARLSNTPLPKRPAGAPRRVRDAAADPGQQARLAALAELLWQKRRDEDWQAAS